MKAAIFYFSPRAAADRYAVSHDGKNRKLIGFVRGEVVQCLDIADALSLAAPRADEVLMNAHSLEEQDWAHI